MITYVSGTLAAKSPAEAVIDAGGLGYAIQIPTSSYERLPAVGKPARLLTHFHVREDAQLLYGFATEAERSLFRTMIGVSGVGPRLALAALSAFPADSLRDHILEGDASVLTRIPGVGKKTAERLIVELRDRLADLEDVAPPPAGETPDGASIRADARAALEALGLARAEAEKRIRRVLRDHDGELTAEALIRRALQA
jgi:holliday junction DNA helicase RuvA